ncbi:uncharacterized protein LOC130891358 isoform X1 [Diorhabda carinulata]|uniref:uncharacterized protein LOC130891358 isoform X1 n=2 Tax=Diorhabda carinulata TaxID=1163345 RepID=UPI0025A214DE|nr:uncharacterized protein LOC130891358 isoform X1 [Diorhabda carinulata]
MMIIRWKLIFGFILALGGGWNAEAKKDSKLELSSKCPMLTECPFRAETCSDDDDCSLDAVCCKSPCGKVCTKQLFTGCQTLRMAATRRAKALGVEPKSVRMPRCNKVGGFEQIQCDNEIVSSCWCVDEAGFELAGTRAPAAALVNCTAPKPCADHTCRMFCPHGFSLSADGCPLCRCRDPCDGIKCPNALECHLEELACADPPCPPVPTCKRGRSLDNICPVGDPLRISETVRPFLCGNDLGKPQCPPLYQCLVQTGNDYGVCCPASLKIQKTGMCPNEMQGNLPCGKICSHDLECPSVQKCCGTEKCGLSCIHPENITECLHQRALSELFAISERGGRGYVPQCTNDGQFEAKQCSRNGLVCWCVDRLGRKLKGSMGPAENINCSVIDARYEVMGRSLNKNGKECDQLDCAQVCEYGFKLDEDGCHTCKCDDPCDGFMCPEDEECVNVKESSCSDFFCSSVPVCRPKAVYANPCETGTPLTDDLRGAPVACALRSENGIVCPSSYECTAVPGSTQAVCCPVLEEELESEISDRNQIDNRPQTMCEYLHEFSESMEGTREGMTLALPTPECDSNGNYNPMQCANDYCWCVDNFGTEIPKTRQTGKASKNCTELRETLDCLDLTCRMGCEYGFILDEDTGCPECQCRDPCTGITCNDDEQCQLVEVSCKDHYCPPVPACLPKKVGQCPYLVPATTTSCDFECNSDMACNGTTRCCSNGCGTQCIEPLLLTGCQHQKSLAQHQAHESGMPAGRVYIPACKEDGSYMPKQCNPGTGECWCVDEFGFELSQTRFKSSKNFSCDTPLESKCPLYKCEDNCEHGYELDEKGCRTCECVDPCSKITCRGEGETCRLVSVECISWPCPSVPMCLPKKENPCQNGEPLKLGRTDELVMCGPDYESCPSSHKCQLSPVGEYALCCPKPRDVCFEPLDPGTCADESDIRNLTRFFFNSKTNKCEQFIFNGCQGNHNNFHTENMCNIVCPVLSQCERLREKNQKAADLYRKPTFTPRCEQTTGSWQAVQCLEHVGVCWCVTPQGEPLKGTLTRGAEPECNFRQARRWSSNRSDSSADGDIVLEELMMQIGTVEDVDEPEDIKLEDNMLKWEIPIVGRCESLGGQCDSEGKFQPIQCEEETCWCVDEAGNQLPNTHTFRKGEKVCIVTPIEKADMTLVFRGEFDDISAVPVVNQIKKIIKSLHGNVNNDGIKASTTSDALYIKFSLIGDNKVDVAYKLEQMVMLQRSPGLKADISRSRVIHKLYTNEHINSEKVIALEQREIVSQSPVSVVVPYHTALIVTAAASAFIISVLTLLVLLYRRKVTNSLNPHKISQDDRFITNMNQPIYIELPNEKGVLETKSSINKT